MPQRYSIEELKALRPPAQHLKPALKQHLESLDIFFPAVYAEHKRERKRERNRRRRNNNKTHLPIVTTTNLRSINNKQDELLQYLEDSRTDIACLTETWIQELNILETAINLELREKFHIISNPRRGKQGGGTLVAVRKDYASNCIEIKSPNNQQDDPNALEVTSVRLRPNRLPRGYSTCLISAVYIPPSSNQTIEINALTNHLTDAVDLCPGKPLIYTCGDFNKANTSLIKSQLGIYQLNKKPTRKKAVLDLVLSNAPRCYTALNKKPIASSDHDVITVTPNRHLYRSVTRVKKKRKLVRRGGLAATVEEFDSIDWDATIHAPLSAQQKTDIFYDTALAIIDAHQPLKPSVVNSKDKPWMTEEIKELIAQRQKLFKHKNDEWKALARRIKELINKQKKLYYSHLDPSNPKELWDRVNEQRASDKQEIPPKFSPDELNRGFSSVWDGIQPQDLSTFATPAPDAPADFISPHMVMYQLERLNTKKAPGPDGISAKILYAARFSLCFIITHILNLSIQHSFVPTQWKSANITPIAKVDHPQSTGDYRHIALISTICKILKRIVVRVIIGSTREI